jgi:hypothetical protein
MATRKKASTSSSRAAAKSSSSKKSAAPRAPKRKVRSSAAADDEAPDRDVQDKEVDDENDDGDASGDDAAELRDVHDASADGDEDDDDKDDVLPPATRPRAVQRAAPGAPPIPPRSFAPPRAMPPSSVPPRTAPPSAVAPRAVPPRAVAPPAPFPPAPVATGATFRPGSRPFVVARGDDSTKVFGETLKHSGFYEAVENAQIKSGKRRELFEVSCKVDFMRGVRRESEPVSYVDPKLVAQLFNGLLDRGFRILRVVETRNELSRYLANRSVKQVGNALGFDESCYELRDLAEELVPVELATGKRPTGRYWKQADFRIVFAKNRTDEHWGPALVLWNLWHVMATPPEILSLEYGLDPGEIALTLLEKLPVHFALIDAVHSRDGAPGGLFPYETLKAADPAAPDAAQLHRLGTIVAGSEPLAVEAAGHKLQGLDPLADPIALRAFRKKTAWKAPNEVDGLPTFPGWKGVGNRIREAIGPDKQPEALRLSLATALANADARLFPPLASAYGTIRLRQKVAAFLDELRRRHGVRGGAPAGAADHGPDRGGDGAFEADGDDDDGDDGPADGPSNGPANGPRPGGRAPAAGDDDPPTFL